MGNTFLSLLNLGLNSMILGLVDTSFLRLMSEREFNVLWNVVFFYENIWKKIQSGFHFYQGLLIHNIRANSIFQSLPNFSFFGGYLLLVITLRFFL